jgi:hypothetical protein
VAAGEEASGEDGEEFVFGKAEEVQKANEGVFGKAVWSMVGFVLVRSMIVDSSITAGKRQLKLPPRVSEAQ